MWTAVVFLAARVSFWAAARRTADAFRIRAARAATFHVRVADTRTTAGPTHTWKVFKPARRRPTRGQWLGGRAAVVAVAGFERDTASEHSLVAYLLTDRADTVKTLETVIRVVWRFRYFRLHGALPGGAGAEEDGYGGSGNKYDREDACRPLAL